MTDRYRNQALTPALHPAGPLGMGFDLRNRKFMADSAAAGGKPVAFAALKADEPREAKQAAFACFGRGKSGRTDPHV